MKAVGIGTRVFEFLIDTLFIFALSFAAYKGWTFYAYYWGIIYFQYGYFFWAITFVYYLFFESIFKRTPGKWASLTKVVKLNGGKPSFGQIFLRTLVRLLFIFDWLAFPLLNERALHDYLSKTEVVEI